MSDRPIADYAFLSDCHSAALVSRSGSVDWLCFPRFDAPSLFGRILDPDAGHWEIRPRGDSSARRRYVEGGLVLETRFEGPDGVATLTDALALGGEGGGHDLGRGAPHVLLRRLRCTEGKMAFRMEFAPRPEYGVVHPLLLSREGGLAARGGPVALALSTDVPVSVEGSTASAAFALEEGESAAFALRCSSMGGELPEPWAEEEIERRLEETVAAWRHWSELHQSYDGPWRDRVHLGGRVLQGLTFQPTGAIVAAPTTSLPETVGGERNWDYRYTWIRDASFTLEALWVAACPDEAHRFFDFFVRAAPTQLRRGKDLQIMFGIGGEHDLTERELPHLRGWRGSRPVRVGNGAWGQRQLDVYGELLSAAYRLREHLEELHDEDRRFLVEVADAAAARWQEKDKGIWEIRGPDRHYLYSKLMCWVAVDRGIRMADLLRAGDRIARWEEARETIRAAILERGWSEEAGAFVQAFDSDELDASNLVIPIVGFLPGDNARVLATVEATEERLTDRRGLVYRYRSEDGLEGEEGTFLLCTFWLAQALALAGRVDRAREVFERACGYANDMGLLSEEADPESGELLGNFPQAFSHIGLVNAAWAIAGAERAAREPVSG